MDKLGFLKMKKLKNGEILILSFNMENDSYA